MNITDIMTDSDKKIIALEDKIVALTRKSVYCPNCGTLTNPLETYYFSTDGADDGDSLWLRCTECKYEYFVKYKMTVSFTIDKEATEDHQKDEQEID